MKKLLTVFLAAFLLLGLTGCQKSETTPLSSTEEESGLKIEILRAGDGETAKDGDFVVVHYVGTLTDGTKFDSSRDRGQPFPFALGSGQVIPGWDQGVAGMKIGELRKLTIPPELAYGERGLGPVPGNATLIFEVELMEIKSWEEVLQGGMQK